MKILVKIWPRILPTAAALVSTVQVEGAVVEASTMFSILTISLLESCKFSRLNEYTARVVMVLKPPEKELTVRPTAIRRSSR